MILADLTERKIQECVKLGITADFGSTSVTDGKAHFKKDGCNNVTTNSTGLLSLNYLITLILKDYRVNIQRIRVDSILIQSSHEFITVASPQHTAHATTPL